MTPADELYYTLSAIRAVSDLLCEQPDMHMVNPDNLNALITILADKLEAAIKRIPACAGRSAAGGQPAV